MDKFKNKYRIASARATWWNYSNVTLYYVTICSKHRRRFFGSVSDRKMNLSEIGQIAEKYWYEIPDHFSFVKLHAFVVMPDHVHMIIEIANSPEEALHATPVHDAEKNMQMAAISPKRGSLASIIRSYKSAVSRDARKVNSNFAWQSRFYDHIIRDDGEYDRISNYIIDNPKNWKNK